MWMNLQNLLKEHNIRSWDSFHEEKGHIGDRSISAGKGKWNLSNQKWIYIDIISRLGAINLYVLEQNLDYIELFDFEYVSSTNPQEILRYLKDMIRLHDEKILEYVILHENCLSNQELFDAILLSDISNFLSQKWRWKKV